MKKQIKISPYNGTDSNILELIKLVERSDIKTHFIILHGSYADGSNINYSDFDGLIIYNDIDVNEKNKTDKFIKQSLKLIYKIDPLQHHGWFVINKSQLSNYPQDYFPYEIFEYSKSLTGEEIEFEIDVPDNSDYINSFKSLKKHLLITIEEKKPENLYRLKSFLSGMMLMPGLYIQAKINKGCYKKDSFALAEKDFSAEQWLPIEIASKMRQGWNYKLNFLRSFFMTKQNRVFRILTKRFFSPGIPEEYRRFLTDNFYSSCKNLLDIMESKLEN